ncbi:HalD/BesD family halogenase [Enterovibrio norvegicus]|uniref:HalD/BesD family halogenase n=1 Tax=Enterovibrio norvegicus TaxID=188144 RepID=UPI000C850613|nr:2OG-Fe(II) oxygenase [Enterovibrio norvegicus]PML80012.1 arpA protein [Enterovibrio norvegicus]
MIDVSNIVDTTSYQIDDEQFYAECKRTLDEHGVLVLRDFLRPEAISSIQREGEENQHLAFYSEKQHNIYLTPFDDEFAEDHPRNRLVSSSKGCITTDQIPQISHLHSLYEDERFQRFLCNVLGEQALYPYDDPLSSVNLHYASEGQELGWHFDNSSFAITLMIQSPEGGGAFEYVKDVRDADKGEMNFERSGQILDGMVETKTLAMDAGALVLFRGRNAMHRVTPVVGDITRMLVVLAYNTEKGISLSESARMTFYGRLG